MIGAIVRVPGVGRGQVTAIKPAPEMSAAASTFYEVDRYRVAIDFPSVTVWRTQQQLVVITPPKLSTEPSPLVQFLRSFDWHRSAA